MRVLLLFTLASALGVLAGDALAFGLYGPGRDGTGRGAPLAGCARTRTHYTERTTL